MSDTGLLDPLGEPPNASPACDGAPDGTLGDRPPLNLLRLRSDAVAVNRALKKVAILVHCLLYDSIDRDRPAPPRDLPTPLGTEPEAGDEDDAEMGIPSRAQPMESMQSLSPTTTKTSKWASPHQTGRLPTFTCGRQSIRAAYERKQTKYKGIAQAIGGRPSDPGW
jgi:hypothetical protein